MADPTKYSRGYSFSNFRANTPNQPLPGNRVDVELDDVAGKLGEAIDAIKDIRRSDGKLKAGSIDSESLSTDLVDQIVDDALTEAAASATAAGVSADTAEASALAASVSAEAAAASEAGAEAAAATSVANAALLGVWRGPWAGPGTIYAAGDRVSEAGNSYYATAGHTSAALFSTDLSALKWGTVAEKGASGPGGGDLLSSQNLNDVANKATARANLSVPETSTVLLKSGNLSGLADAAAARTNIGAQSADADLSAISGLTGVGLLARTGAGVYAERAVVSTDGSVAITNPAGTAGNVDLSVDVLDVVATAAVDDIGAYALLRQTTVNNARSAGDIVAGANLRYESVAGNGSGGTPPGNWMCCGAISSGSTNATNTTLWRRVS